jgi:hypothetical protein
MDNLAPVADALPLVVTPLKNDLLSIKTNWRNYRKKMTMSALTIKALNPDYYGADLWKLSKYCICFI